MEFEFNPAAVVLGIIGGFVTVIVMSQVDISPVFKVLGFIGGTFLGFIIANWRLGAD